MPHFFRIDREKFQVKKITYFPPEEKGEVKLAFGKNAKNRAIKKALKKIGWKRHYVVFDKPEKTGEISSLPNFWQA